MPTVGGTLSAERIRQGLGLAEVSGTTKIGTRALQAIEADDFEFLPAALFARNFIRQYANFLAIEPEPLVAQFDKVNSAREAALVINREVQPQFLLSNVLSSGRSTGRNPLSAFLGFVGTIALCGGIYYGYLFWRERRVHGTAVPPKSALAIQPVHTAAGVTEPVTPNVAALPSPSKAPPEASAAAVRAEVTGVEPTWIRVTADRKIIFTGVLQAGESKTFSGSEKISILAGNAGGFELKWNGRIVNEIGPKGQVRTVDMTAASAQIRQNQLLATPAN